MNNQIKGLNYEKFIKNLIINYLNKNAYLWHECPEDILISNNLIHSHNDLRLMRKDIKLKEGHLHNYRDIGIDIIQIETENDNKCSIIQCKNGYSNGLTVNDIAGIMMRTAFANNNIKTYIYYTNKLSNPINYTSKISSFVSNIDCTNDLSQLLDINQNSNKINFIKLPFDDNHDTNENQNENKIISPFEYQLEAYNSFKNNYTNNNRGMLSLPCGTGKTYTSYLISNDYNQIIIISPLREFANQNLQRFIEYGYDESKSLLIDSDGIREIIYIENFIKTNNKFLISCTYNSMDLISECLNLFKNPLFIIDEFHNLSKANISDDNNYIYKLLKSNHRILFMSATPRIYDIEYDESSDYEDNNCELFGEIVYQMNFTDAIANEYICDYRIWLPSIHEDNEELDRELSIYEINNKIKNRCKFLYSCIANKGSRKVIVYCKDTNDMNNMIESMKTLNDFYIMNIEIDSISCEDSESKRKQTLKNFSEENNKINLLFNIRILNECIDIPACDSIYISYPPKNKITTIQRISRAIRKNKNNPNKIANIFIWCNEYEEILETLSSIKEYDSFFKDKIKLNILNFHNNQNKTTIKLIETDNKIINDYIIGIKEFKLYTWDEKLQMVIDYIKENNKLPSKHDKNKEIKSLGHWLSRQKKNYKNNTEIMKNEEIRNKWEEFINEYEEFFKSNEEIWEDNLNKVIEYIKKKNKLPSTHDKNKEIELMGQWLSHQKTNYKNNKHIMINKEIRNKWEKFINEYEEFFKSNEEIWQDNLNKVIEYIKKNNKLPSTEDKNKEIKSLGQWLSNQKKNYKENKHIMINKEIRNEWEKFTFLYISIIIIFFISNFFLKLFPFLSLHPLNAIESSHQTN